MLTPKQERFCQLVAEGKSQADAYREAFNVRETTKAKTIHEAASKLAAKVAPRIEEIRKPVVERVQITLEQHLRDLADLKAAAAQAEQYGAAIKAEELRAKASGLYTEKHQITGADGLPINIAVKFIKP